MRAPFLAILGFALAFAQDRTTVQLKQAVEHLKTSKPGSSRQVEADHLSHLQGALREWIESRLPAGEPANQARFAALEADLNRELDETLGAAPDTKWSTDLRPGYARVEVKWFPELAGTVFVLAHVTAGCGFDDAVYMYDVRGERWKRMFADHPRSAWGWENAKVEISDPAGDGRRLLLVDYSSTQCASFWMGSHYSVYRIDVNAESATRLTSNEHGFYLGNHDGALAVLRPNELILEFLDHSLDSGIHNRTNIQRYSFVDDRVTRLDPVAFQPQDFAEEWLTRPWDEMSSRSEPGLEEWHEKFRADFLAAEYRSVVPCAARPDRWLIDLGLTNLGEKELSEPEDIFLLVHALGSDRYSMEAVSEDEPEGCPGDAPASEKHPWRSRSELEKIH